jgi:hypothetical protein
MPWNVSAANAAILCRHEEIAPTLVFYSLIWDVTFVSYVVGLRTLGLATGVCFYRRLVVPRLSFSCLSRCAFLATFAEAYLREWLLDWCHSTTGGFVLYFSQNLCCFTVLKLVLWRLPSFWKCVRHTARFPFNLRWLSERRYDWLMICIL